MCHIKEGEGEGGKNRARKNCKSWNMAVQITLQHITCSVVLLLTRNNRLSVDLHEIVCSSTHKQKVEHLVLLGLSSLTKGSIKAEQLLR